MQYTIMLNFGKLSGFEWDEGNAFKNLLKHNVTQNESEEIFSNEPLVVAEDTRFPYPETRYQAFGKTNFLRKLHITFTVRNNQIRIISARDMNKKEREIYEIYT